MSILELVPLCSRSVVTPFFIVGLVPICAFYFVAQRYYIKVVLMPVCLCVDMPVLRLCRSKEGRAMGAISGLLLLTTLCCPYPLLLILLVIFLTLL